MTGAGGLPCESCSAECSGHRGAVLAGADAGLGRAVGGAKSPAGAGTSALSPTGPTSGAGTTTTSAPAGATTTAPSAAGTRIGLASQVPVGGAATFTDPATGDPGLVFQLTKDQFVAYDAVCPHAGCTVGYSPGAKLIVCTCHGGGQRRRHAPRRRLSPGRFAGAGTIVARLERRGRRLRARE